ncbi:MAG: DUF1585 domain-containing protein [Verrucomicrobia bacterium]|nr:DUF1585 domain-containing protein [Verrucomicrobiota bacterium]
MCHRYRFFRCFIHHPIRLIQIKTLPTYALGRGLEYYDKCAVDQVMKGLAKGKYKFSALVLEVARSVPFQMRRGEGERVPEVAGP